MKYIKRVTIDKLEVMKPAYVFKNVQTKNTVCFTNARLAFELYRELSRLDDAAFFAYSTFRQKLKYKPILRFLQYSIERPYLIGNPDFDLATYAEHLVTAETLDFPKCTQARGRRKND